MGCSVRVAIWFWVEDRETSVDMPFLAVDTDCQIDLDMLDATDVTAHHPRELVVRMPCFAHGKECRMSNGLCIGGDAVMFFRCEVDKIRLEAC